MNLVYTLKRGDFLFNTNIKGEMAQIGFSEKVKSVEA